MKFADYQRHAFLWNSLFWGLVLTLIVIVNATTELMEYERSSEAIQVWEPFVWELSSAIAWLILLYPILGFNHRWPLKWGSLWRHGLIHLGCSVAISVGHVVLMFSQREWFYNAVDVNYDRGDWGWVLLYEYRKDLLTYFLFLAAIALHRLVISRLAGEAAFVAESEETSPSASQRFLVKKLGKEFVVQLKDVDWIEASGNYVNLHLGERLYPVRSTMAQMEERVKAYAFCRVHRSGIVNVERITSIEPQENGDSRINLVNGHRLKCSRSYRENLKTMFD